MLYQPFYNPEKSYEENFKEGPYGIFSDKEIFSKEGEPQYDFFGHKVYSPFGIPAGPLINGNFVQAALDKGFDIVTYKTVRTKKYPCHPWPNVLAVHLDGDLTIEKANNKLIANGDYKEPLSITNSFGVPSFEPEFWRKDIEKIVKNNQKGQIIVGAFQGTKTEDGNVENYINDFRLAARLLKESGIKVFEVNFSCPNEGTANLLCFDVGRSELVAEAIKEEIGELPLIVKIAYFKDEEMLKNFVQKVGAVVQGISAINTISALIIDKDGNQALPGVDRSRSGVCGHSIKWAGLEMVERLKKLREELGYSYTIIGV
jgi:dihydroorotate dehydrogenase